MREAASEAAMERLLDALVGSNASEATRESFKARIIDNSMNDTEVEIEVAEERSMPFDMGNMGGNVGMIDLSDMMGKALGKKPTKRQKLRVPGAWDKLVDLLPLIEGTTVATKYGPMKTDHVLFIASGAFHVAKPSDMLPELQGRLPIRLELRALTEEDFVRILSETRANLVEQYRALIGTEKVELDITTDAVAEVAKIAAQVNESVENIGARRLQTVMEKLLEEISFEAEEYEGQGVTIDAAYVQERLSDLAGNSDLSKYIL